MAIEVLKTIAPPMPCNTRAAIRESPPMAAALNILPSVNTNMPHRKNRVRPNISVNFPTGISSTAVASKNDDATQLSVIEVSPNSLPIDGKATVIAELIKGVIKEVSVLSTRIECSRKINFIARDENC